MFFLKVAVFEPKPTGAIKISYTFCIARKV